MCDLEVSGKFLSLLRNYLKSKSTYKVNYKKLTSLDYYSKVYHTHLRGAFSYFW